MDTIVNNEAAVTEAIYRLSVLTLGTRAGLGTEYQAYINKLLEMLPLNIDLSGVDTRGESDAQFAERLLACLEDGFEWASTPDGAWYWVTLHYNLLGKLQGAREA